MRSCVFLILAVLLPLALSDEEPDPSDTVQIYVRALLENLRKHMPTGIPELGVPPLDPLSVPLIDERIKEGLADVHIKITDLKGEGLASFNVRKVKFDIATMQLEVGLFFPMLSAQSNYSLDGTIAKLFPLYGKGDAMFHMTDFEIQAKTKVDLSSGKPQVSQFNIELSFSSINALFNGILGGGNLGDLINTVINMFGKAIFDSQRPNIEQALNGVILNAINNELKKVDLGKIIPSYSAAAYATTANANDYVDQVLKNLRPRLQQNDPLKLPYVRDGFEKKVGFIKFKGYAELRTGSLTGFTSLHRSGDVTLTANNQTGDLTLSANLAVSNLRAYYDCKVYFMGAKAYPKLHGTIGRVSAFAKVRLNLLNGQRELSDFKITAIDHPKVKVTNLSIFGYLVSFIANLAIRPIINGVRGNIEGAVRDLLAQAIRDADIPLGF